MTRWQWGCVIALLIAAAVRFGGLFQVPHQTALAVGRAATLEAAADSGVAYVFSEDAANLLGVGNDGQPGIAGRDDNADGRLDDDGELGAVGSDDQCLGPADAGYDQLISHPSTIVISRGGFVPAEKGVAAQRFLTGEFGWVILDGDGSD